MKAAGPFLIAVPMGRLRKWPSFFVPVNGWTGAPHILFHPVKGGEPHARNNNGADRADQTMGFAFIST